MQQTSNSDDPADLVGYCDPDSTLTPDNIDQYTAVFVYISLKYYTACEWH